MRLSEGMAPPCPYRARADYERCSRHGNEVAGAVGTDRSILRRHFPEIMHMHELARSTRRQDAAALVFRVLFSLIFLVAGTGHLTQPAKIVNRLNNAPMGELATAWAPPELLVFLSGMALVAGGGALLLGFQTRYAALLLALVLIPITLTVQVGTAELGPLFKNIALFGGLVHFWANGSPKWSLDGALGTATRDKAQKTADVR